MDSKVVTLLSSTFNPQTTTTVKRTQKSGKRVEVTCPAAVAAYNKIMGGVDRFDQRKQTYYIGKRSKRWCHRILYFQIDLAVAYSFVLFKLKRNTAIDALNRATGEDSPKKSNASLSEPRR